MKRIVSIFLISFILICSLFPISSYADASGYENIKIGLHYSSGGKESVVLNCDSGFELGYEDENGDFVLISPLVETEITVALSPDGTIEVSGIYSNTEFPNLCISPGYGNLRLNGQDFRGSMIFLKNSAGLMNVINKVNLEEYLYSVLGREMSPRWPIEALKAQAICARTYAINNWNKYASQGFNLDNTQNSQVYSGMNSEGERTIQAVEETRGQLVMYDGKPAQTFYYSSNGGKSANVKYVWGSEFPYLVSVEDPYENPDEASYYNWEQSYTPEEIKSLLEKSKIDIGDVKNIEIVASDNGTVYNVKITGETGSHSVKNGSVRSFFGLKSQYFTLKTPEAVTTYPTLTVLGASGLATLSSANVVIHSGSTTESLSVLSSGGMKVYTPETTEGSGKYVFSGHGWGHRIGMSQWGAKAMADMGLTSSDILTHYFNGTTVDDSLLKVELPEKPETEEQVEESEKTTEEEGEEVIEEAIGKATETEDN